MTTGPVAATRLPYGQGFGAPFMTETVAETNLVGSLVALAVMVTEPPAGTWTGAK
jgi:hypothetical protein